MSNYLKRLNLPAAVWISGDGSGIMPKIEYDSATNQLVGFVLPFGDNGQPIPFTYLARSANEIESQMKDETLSKASLVYLVMARPLKEDIPPFVLSVFGTDNKFTTY